MLAAIDWYDSGLSAGDALSTDRIIGIAFGAVTAVLALLHIIRMIGSFITHKICVKKNNNKQRGKYYYNSQ